MNIKSERMDRLFEIILGLETVEKIICRLLI